MANKIKGLTLEIGGEVGPLNKALAGVNKTSRDLQSELRGVERLLKLDPSNTELLNQKQKILAESVANTSDKLSKLKDAEKDAQKQFKEGKVSEEQYRALQREVIKTESELKELERSAKEFGTTMSQQLKAAGDNIAEFGSKLKDVGKEMTTKVTLPIAAAGTVAFKFAADLEDAMGASDQIFKASAEEVKTWADGLNAYYGIAESEALTYANTMGAMLQNIGKLSEEEAAKQTQMLVELAGDLTAMFGGTTESAIQALTGALKGNTTMLDNYGMGVNDATIKTKAFEMGLYDGKGVMELATKQAATLALIMEQTGDAQGQAAREAEGASGSLRALTTELKNISGELGEVLIPIFLPFIQKIKDIIGSFKELTPETQELIVKIALLAAALGPLLSLIGTITMAAPGLIAAFTFLITPIGLVIAGITALVAAFVIYNNTIPQVQKGTIALAKEAKKLANDYEESTATLEESTAAALSNATAAKVLVDELYTLDEQLKNNEISTDNATAAKERMKTITDELNRLMPDLVIAFNNTTGAVMTERAEVDKLVDSYTALAMAKAYQAKLDKAAASIVDAEENKKKAQERLEDIRQSDPLLSSQKLRDMKERKAVYDTISESDKLITKANADMKGYIDNISKYKKDAGDTVVATKTNEIKAIAATTKAIKTAGKTEKKVTKDVSKEKEKIEKDLVKEMEMQRDKQFRDLKFYLDMGEITEEDYYNTLGQLRDEYFTADTDEWQKYTLEINNYKLKQAEEVKNNIKAIYKEITETALSEIEDIKKAQDGLSDKLKGYGQLFKETTTTIRGYGEHGQDMVYKTISLGDLDKDIDDLKAYEKALSELNKKAPKGFFDVMRDMSVEEGLKFSEQLLSVTDKEFDSFIKSWETKNELSDAIAGSLYSDDFIDSIEKAANISMGALTENYEKYGEGYADAIGEGFLKTIGAVLTKMKVSMNAGMNALNLTDAQMGAVGNSTYAPTINMFGKPASPSEAFAAATNQYKIDKLRGLAT